MNFDRNTHPADQDKPEEIALYVFTLMIRGERYGGHIPARSWEEAEQMVGMFGGEVDGRLVSTEDSQSKLCAICGGRITHDEEHPQPVEEEFPDTIE